MSQELEEIPLFPLEAVLFPGADVRLHIFEPRYLEMVQTCLEEDRPFGIVLIRSGSSGSDAEPYLVGTAVRIVEVHNYADGRMDIQVRGERRFRIRRIDDSSPYLIGYVEPVIEVGIYDNDEVTEKLREATQEFIAHIRRAFADAGFSAQVQFTDDDPTALSFAMANLVQMSNLEKQHLLEVTDTLERINGLIPILQRQALETKHPVQRMRSGDLREWITPN